MRFRIMQNSIKRLPTLLSAPSRRYQRLPPPGLDQPEPPPNFGFEVFRGFLKIGPRRPMLDFELPSTALATRAVVTTASRA
ncbi:MAG: hypothetical protein AAGE94_21145, partial [Acidobacteriota bacterium]